jgi:hypothetical protein
MHTWLPAQAHAANPEHSSTTKWPMQQPDHQYTDTNQALVLATDKNNT